MDDTDDNNPAESFKRLTVSSQKCELSTSQATLSAYAMERARLLFGSYQKGDANDPETYVAVVAATLSRYPEDMITDVTHYTGLPKRKDFLPTVREVYLACEEIMRPSTVSRVLGQYVDQ